ncbi:hypothetical protein AAGV28_09020 [Flavobacterium sp. FZUC8N2.13]|uniref:Uncharacterized protein n=1 Tax=Flavobacterium zubiriense TaxID=3138075 RepID=A0ABV4TEP4_9FLAO
MKKGIVLVANLKSQLQCENLIYSIRKSACNLPIRLIHFGGEPVNSKYILEEVEFLTVADFSEEAIAFVNNLRTVLTDCPMGYLYRFLAWFSDWDEFIYADNDIVALMNWERMFEFTEGVDLVHADKEYTTFGIFNYLQPHKIEEIFGKDSLNSAITAGHMLVKKNPKMIKDINAAVNWFNQNPEIPKKHDQALLHIAALLGDWKLLNLCKPPHNWLSSWSGDYKNSLDLIQAIQSCEAQKIASFKTWYASLSEENKNKYKQPSSAQTDKVFISHLHYSGRGILGSEPIDELLFSNQPDENRKLLLFKILSADLFCVTHIKKQIKRVQRYLVSKKMTTNK